MGKLVWHWKVRHTSKWLRVIALGVQPEFRGEGVDAMLYLQTARNAITKGYAFAEMSWILEFERYDEPLHPPARRRGVQDLQGVRETAVIDPALLEQTP